SIANWGVKNKLTSTTTTVTRLNESPYTRSVSFTYDATKGSLETKTEDNGLLTTYEHTNGLGNVTKSTLSGGGVTTRSTIFIYDAKGRFVEETINPLNQHSYATYDARWGVPITQTGVDGLTTTYQYDDFGRLTTATTPDNITTTSTLAWEVGGGSATNPLTADNSIYTVTTTTEGSPTQKTWYDSFGRPRKMEVDGFDKKINQVTTYDNRGNVATTTTPFFATDEPLVTTYTYNDLNLANTIVSEIGTTSFGYVYSTGDHTITTTRTLPDGNSSTSITDATGKLIKAIDNGGTLDYTYYSSGLQKDIKLNTVLVASMEYDNNGNQKKLIDPNAGTTEYIYNNLGELTYQKDAKNNEYTITYDALGRMATKTENGTSFGFTYYTNGNGINQPDNITYNGITQHFTYDYLGRLTETKETFEGEDYVFGYQYDDFNRIEQTSYPSGFKTKHHYNSFSYPTTVTDEQATNTYWQAGSMNAYNQYKTYTLGNGQTTTKIYDEFGLPTQISTTNPNIQNLLLNFNPQNGNLMSRANPTKNLLEEFTYDNLNRLEETKVNGVIQLSTQYQGNGNIGFKTDAGNYTYDVNLKNAVVQVSNPYASISTNLQDITYNAFNSVNTIIENNNELTFTYGADQQRRKMEHKVGGTVEKTTFYFGNYEKIKLANGDVTELHYIGGGDGLVAIHVITTPNTQPSSPTTFYTYTDHLGSITTLTDQNATIVYEQNFDAWGRERNPNTWDYANATVTGSVTGFEWLTRGYTGHEHLAEFGLINMNGRLYDPVLGRMLSPDNYVQDATSTQGYNRYSYVVNNPLKYTDPSGESFEDFTRGVVDFFTFPGRLPSVISEDGLNPSNWDWDYLSGKQAPMAYRKDPAGLQSLGNYTGSLNSDFLGSEGGATDASGESIDMNAMNEEAWNNRRDRMDKAFLQSLGNGSINLPVTPIEAIRDDPRGVQGSWDRFLENSNPTIDKGGFIDNKGEFISFMTDQAKNNPVEVAAFGLNNGSFFVQPWINNTAKFADNDFNHPSLKGLTITSQYHTHPNGSGLSHKD
ncbi:MAG: RHS repeat-associated core domain-containing protein, partial [Flavobacteriales bacterium]|nr:RHS repeat-associated core domain-containing protein [Flavobacteriales bacterium]